MWTKVQKRIDEETAEQTIYLPDWLSSKLKNYSTIKFGIKTCEVTIKSFPSEQTNNHCFENPLPIYCSEDILNELLINQELTYQLVITNNELSIGPVIGFLLGEQHYYYHDRHMHEYSDAMGIYTKIGGMVIAFKECSIDWDNRFVLGLFYDPTKKKWKYGKLPLPSVVYRRGYKLNQNVAEKLSKITKNNVFNSYRFDKWALYQYLKQHREFKEYLPDTLKLDNYNEILNYLSMYKNVILKPSDLSRGRGIYIFKQHTKDSLLTIDYNDGDKRERIIPHWAFKDYLKQEELFNKNYIIQPFLELATIDGSPWDIRIVMQKNYQSGWKCSGIECRVAGQSQFVTNISRGGKALPITKALELSFGQSVHSKLLKNKVISISEKFCELMEETGEHFAEFGLDVAFDVDQNLWFIEANIRPTFYGFKKMDLSNYKYICENPLRYAAAVAGFNNKK